MSKIVVDIIVVIYIEKMFVNCADYMHKKCCEMNYSLRRDI